MHALSEWLDVSRQTHAYVLLWVFGDFGTKSVCVCGSFTFEWQRFFFSKFARVSNSNWCTLDCDFVCTIWLHLNKSTIFFPLWRMLNVRPPQSNRYWVSIQHERIVLLFTLRTSPQNIEVQPASQLHSRRFFPSSNQMSEGFRIISGNLEQILKEYTIQLNKQI